MSDYGSRGYGRDPDDYGWPGNDGGRSDSHGRGPQGGDHGHRSSGYGSSGYGSGDAYGRDSYGSGSGDDYGRDSYGSGHSGGYGSGHDDYGTGRADSYGSARSGGYDDSPRTGGYGDEPVRGSASVPTSGGGYSPHDDEPKTTGRARVPGGDSTGPGRARGTARVGGKRGGALSEEEQAALAKTKKKKRRRRRLIAFGCVSVVLLGMVTVVGSLFFQSVELPKDVIEEHLDQNTTILFADGSEMGSYGTEAGNRTEVKYEDVPDEVIWALVAGEDQKFFDHSGVDFWGVMRALWNNVTGGDRQGASTLTQQYVGQVMKITGDVGYFDKANEAVMAMKMDDEYKKEEIIEFYLNLVYMGRGAYGLGAAIEAWYGPDKKLEDLTASEASLIFAQVKSPDGSLDPRNPCDVCGLTDEEAYDNAEGRWEYFLNSMLKMKKLTPEQHKQYIDDGLPETAETTSVSASEGADEDTGFVSHGYVLAEAQEKAGLTEQDLLTKGYTITTTIDPAAQQAAVDVASQKDGSYMSEQKENLRAALVSIDPATGRVVAYFGGTTDGTGVDKAGYDSMHPPGSSFKEFTLITALSKGISMDSMWDGTSPQEFPGLREGDKAVVNSGNQSEPRISLKDTMRQSLNTPIYAITNQVGAGNVMLTARNMGINKVVTPDADGNPQLVDLWDPEVEELLMDPANQRAVVDNEIGFGQFPVSVFDMAVANATLAAGGVYHEPHFIKEIKNKDGDVVYSDEEEGAIEVREAVTNDVARDAIHVSSTIWPGAMSGSDGRINGQPIAGKTGTWERYCPDNPACDQNSAIWYAGFTKELSAAVWVGDKADENGVVAETWDAPAYGSTISGSVWHKYMTAATQIEGYNEVKEFDPPANVGDKNAGNAKEEEKKDDKCDRPGNREDCEDGGEDGGDGGNDDGNPPASGQCQPGSPEYPDCNQDQVCDPEFPECQPDQSCNPFFPMDPDCTENGEGSPGDNRNESRVGSDRLAATATTARPYALPAGRSRLI
ncbi:membrane peptidoglycan carboxypeptidase [Stackebrandtia albiflava]|uniref:Membrane peptidoglycan carboxypeptidase n=1 Tax=Stackebrandtia albiflava TaxID=406432 RepID=A0A562V2L8_9ACTN|nr:transglycosylase domain-containing protein [Stackebrandtia albiflava]TWJ12124.1 membrane peptidoglycan carboxypeptidase [Stackebrandtia albiflava]